ncbi:tetratricopeptide repeat protein [Nocardia sp. A7]|uniref:ATP-binding protein n=1 Tax=Nocardia sp. A7 TaxID=2789274 RepID=UPI0039781610
MSLTLSGAALASAGGDPGLWLVPNWARADAVTGRPSAGHVNQLTRDLFITKEVRACVRQIVTGEPERLQLVIGPAGSGKSAIMGMLIRATERKTIPVDFICAAVFLDAASGPESVAEELATQLTRTLDGFKEASATTARTLTENQQRSLGAFDRMVTLPLAAVRTDEPFHIIIDGLDQPDIGNRESLIDAISAMTTNAQLPDLCVIVGVREGTGVEVDPRLGHGSTVRIGLPSTQVVMEAVAQQRKDLARTEIGAVTSPHGSIVGGWLIARLLTEISQLPPEWSADDSSTLSRAISQRIEDASALPEHSVISTERVHEFLAIVAAAGVGPVLPIEVAHAAFGNLGSDAISRPTLRGLITSLGSLIVRAAPSTNDERIGLAHLAFSGPVAEHITVDLTAAHLAIANSLTPQGSSQMLAYRAKAGARHLALGGRAGDAVALVDAVQSDRPIDNLTRWTALLPELPTTDSDDTLTTRHNIAYWRGQSGDPAGALTELELLLPDRQRILGSDHPETLRTRNNIAFWRGRAGGKAGALTAFELLLPDQHRILGPDHPDTLTTQKWIAYLQSQM